MYTNEILLSAKFYKSLPEGRRIHILRKLKYFFTIYAQSQNTNIHTSARRMEIRGVPGVYKLRTSRSERILYEINQDNNIILREYSSHDNQIIRAKNMMKNEESDTSFSSLFNDSIEEKDFENYEVELLDDSLMSMDQEEIIIATDEWISGCEDTQDFIWLASAEQAEIISSNQYPQFISGSAGTGKSTVLFQKLCGLAQNNGEILYITISPVLKDDFQRIYEKFKPKQEKARITFLTIDELYDICMPDHKKIAMQEQFLIKFNPICQRMNVNPQDVWCEIEGIIKSHLGITKNTTISFLDQILNSASTTLSNKNYNNVKNKYSYFSIESRDRIYKIAQMYDEWLAEQNLADINQLAAEIIKFGINRKYNLIMIDEVQDFTELQLYMLMKFAKSVNNIIFCGDINQNVRPTFFMFERLYNIYYSLGCKNAKENMYTLTKNYRSCKEIVLLLNKILDEQGLRIGFQGSKEDEGIHETGFRDGFIPVHLESNEDNLSKIFNAICDKHYAIAVTPDIQTQSMLADHFPEAKSRLFTVQEAKGLEYNVVFTVDITSVYEKEWNRIINNDDVKRKRRFRRFFGYIYVAASRARNNLIITEKKDCSFLTLINGTYESIDEWNLARLGLAKLSSAYDFEKDAGKLEKAGLVDKAKEARVMANKLREKEDQESKQNEYRQDNEPVQLAQQPLVRLTKKLFLNDDNNKKGVVDENKNTIIPCIYDEICFSSYRDKNGKSVFECKLNNKVTYFEQNGVSYRPGTIKLHSKKKKQNKKGLMLIATIVLAFISISLFFLFPIKSPSDIVPHEPIADVITGNIIQVSAGDVHSVALMEDGTVWTWGDNAFEGNTAVYKEFQDRLSISTNSSPESNKPKIKKVDIKDVIAIEAGSFMTAAIKNDGSLWTWGYNIYGALGNGVDFATLDIEFEIDSKPYKIMKNVKSVSLGSSWGMALKKDGSLWTWGLDMHGNLGYGKKVSHNCKPVKIMDDVVEAEAGSHHGIALKSDGTVWVWGNVRGGQSSRSDGKVESVVDPEMIYNAGNQISAGYTHSLAKNKSGSIFSWTYTDDDEIVKPSKLQIDKEYNIEKMISGNNYQLMLSKEGKLYTWDAERNYLYEIMSSVVQASMFRDHFLAIKEDGSVWACGKNTHSNLGDGTLEEKSVPILIYQNK